jgi:hypothetical protein
LANSRIAASSFGADRERKQHISFTCLAETVPLAWARHDQHFTVARPTMDQVEVIRKLAGELGVSIAPLHSFPEIGEVRIPVPRVGPPVARPSETDHE